MDAELFVQFPTVASAGALGMGIAVLEPGVQPAADLFDGEFSETAGVQADAASEEEAQVGEAIMSVDAASSGCCLVSMIAPPPGTSAFMARNKAFP